MTPKQSAFPIEFPRDTAILDLPRRVIAETAPWIEHIPFAFWIVGSAEPRVIVELGTHSGNSYFAMAQAVEERGLPTSMFAVDTWLGDEHSGRYGEEVFRSVSEYNSRNFSSFSALLRGTFDEAREHFGDGEIDLLHIDGYHTYEEVSHDFEIWLPKLSGRSVVLFHDINVRERDFGVHRLWAELAEHYPTFGFDHGSGLGLVGIGSEVPEAVGALLALHDESSTATAVRRLFAVLGRRVLLEAIQADSIAAMQSERDVALDDLRAEHAEALAALRAEADFALAAARTEVELANVRAAGAFDAKLKTLMEAGS